ncbi:hypothetical protein HY409_02430 [Candidatus Gottesmanbacteria bacterium]|nr:hypothetical protein [Candidatus Gottesmanbacteria bacterium]
MTPEKYYDTSIPLHCEDYNITLDQGFRRVLNQSTDLILQTAILLDTGNGELQVNRVSPTLKAQIAEIFSLTLTGVNPDSDEGKRARAAVRPILECFLLGTQIRSIHQDSYLNLLSTSILLARDPRLFEELTISTGFGGSNDEDTNIRAPSYVIPGIKILENLRELKRKNIIDFELPRLRIFFAPYTAISVNAAEMSSEEVLQHMTRTYEYIYKYIYYFHNKIFPYVYFEFENPWGMHDPITREVIQNYSQLLLDSQDDDVKRALAILYARGIKHGNDNGAKLSHVYAAMHPLLFKDSVYHPKVNVFEDGEKSIFAVSIGGRPERMFNIARAYIRRNGRFHPASTSKETSQTLLCTSESEATAASISYEIFSASPDHALSPVASTLAITRVGSTPVYYRTRYDLGIRTYSDSPLSYLNYMRDLINSQLSGAERSLELKRLNEIERDILVMIGDIGSEDLLMKFLSFINS